ncbi:MAG: hypothetical protein ACREDY_20420 [Bradyrhizobium sp.]
MSVLSAEEKARAEAQMALRDIERRRAEAKTRLLREAEVLLNAEFAAPLAAAVAIEHAAMAALDAAKVAAAQIANAEMYRGVLVEWRRANQYRVSWRLSGRRGRYDIWATESARPVNKTWGLPETGDKYIRLIKANGDPSLKFAMIHSWGSAKWLPEGETPE